MSLQVLKAVNDRTLSYCMYKLHTSVLGNLWLTGKLPAVFPLTPS